MLPISVAVQDSAGELHMEVGTALSDVAQQTCDLCTEILNVVLRPRVEGVHERKLKKTDVHSHADTECEVPWSTS